MKFRYWLDLYRELRERESLFIRFLPYVMALAPITLIAVDRYAQFVGKIAKFLAIVQGLFYIHYGLTLEIDLFSKGPGLS